MTAPKLCINCVHYTRADHDHRFWNRCKHPNHGIDLVTGDPLMPPCEMQRAYGKECGERGVLFEPRPSDHPAALPPSQPLQPGAGKPVDFTPGSTNAIVAASMIGEAIDFIEGFRDDPDQVNVVDILENRDLLARTLKGGAA